MKRFTKIPSGNRVLDQVQDSMGLIVNDHSTTLANGLTFGDNFEAEFVTLTLTIPSAATSSEACSAVYSCSTNQAIPNSTNTVINFDTQTLDTDSAVTTGSAWVFTCPVGKAGIYLVSTTALISYQASQTLEQEIFVSKNGSPIFYGPRLATTTNAFAWFEAMSVSPHILLAPGDTVSVSYWQSSAAARTLQGGTQHNWVAITRLNNLGATGPVVPTCFPVTVPATKVTAPVAIWVASCTDTGSGAPVAALASPVWSASNNVVTLRNLAGLVPGRTYSLTLLLVGG